MNTNDDTRALLPAMAEARQRFTEMIRELRPELHRYCARMTGSVFDGEDIVQTAIEKAYYALGQMTEPPQLRPWLFSIAHNAAMDFLKRYEQRNVELVAEVPELEAPELQGVDAALVEAALSVFVRLRPLQRSALILKDVLGHSLEEVATELSISVGAVKGALSRARASVDVHASPEPVAARPSAAEEQANLRRYVELFNDRNWDGLRALLGEESQLDLVTRMKQRVVVAKYFDRYATILESENIRAEAGFVDAVPAIAMYRPATSVLPSYFLLLEWSHGKVGKIRDYYYVPYIALGSRFIYADCPPSTSSVVPVM